MASQWEKLNKPSDSGWGKIDKPDDIITVTTTVTPHSRGKFMGVLGLTYPGTSTTTTTRTRTDWNKIDKPSDSGWGKVTKPLT